MTTLRTAFAASLLTLPALAQDFLLYKFEGSCTAEVVNYAPQGASIGNGFVEPMDPVFSVPSLYGSALAGSSVSLGGWSNRVATGWLPGLDPVVGDFTVAMYLKQRTPLLVPSHLFSSTTGVHLFTGGAAGTGLRLQGVMANGADAVMNADLQSAALSAWAHLAIVVNANAGLVTWYVNGVQVEQDSGFPGGANTSTSTGDFTLGSDGFGNGSVYDLDEVLLSRRIYTPAEIAQLAAGTRAGKGDYFMGTSVQCGPGQIALDATGGRPFLGNTTFALEVATPVAAVHVLMIGFTRCTLGGIAPLPLPGANLLPELTGCMLLADAELLLAGASTGAPSSFPVPIPASAPMGASLYAQALALAPAYNSVAMSFGLALGIGN